MAIIVAQRDSNSFLIGLGPGTFGITNFKTDLGRVYDRLAHSLAPELPVESVLSRGYWEPVNVPDDVEKDVLAEVSEIMAGEK
jgi:hypothetical protein